MDAVPLLNFGKYRNTPLDIVPANYLLWLWKETTEGDLHLNQEIKNWICRNKAHLEDLKATGMGEA